MTNKHIELTDQIKCNKQDVLPDNIKSIDMFFLKDETEFHSMVFHGDKTLKIGITPVMVLRNIQKGMPDLSSGRKETFIVPEDERLIGCQIFHHSTGFMVAISWLTIPK
jgi:hypothetical protein